MATPAERAANIIRTNRYLTLATVDAGAPWIAPINYVTGPGNYLHFYSARGSRHSIAINSEAPVAVAIFDSRAVSDEVDGLQAAARCFVVGDEEVDVVHEYYFRTNFPDPAIREWWYRGTEHFTSGGTWAFYRIELTGVFVIDYESIEQERLDRRLDVDVSDMWKIIRS